MSKVLKPLMGLGLTVFLAASTTNCLLISDVLGVDPVGAVAVETVVKGAAAASGQGWFQGCSDATKTMFDKFGVSGATNCSSTNYLNGGSQLTFLVPYASAARNAANVMIPIAKARRHAFYTETSYEGCQSAAYANAYLITKMYLESKIDVPAGKGITDAAIAESTLFGVFGTGEACFSNLVGTGRVVALGPLNL